MSSPLLRIDSLSIAFRQQETQRTVVDSLSLQIEAGETPEQALIRELQEEVGITPTQSSLFEKLEYQFPDRHITLWFWLVESWEGEPWGKEGQPAQWIAQDALNAQDFPPANAPVIEKLIAG